MKQYYTKKLHNDGATMIVAIVIMTILIVLTFSLTLVAYTLYASQNKNISSMRCAEAANTLSLAFDEELQDKNAAQRSHMYQYIRFNVGNANWPYYAPNEVGGGHDKEYAYRYFNLKYNPDKLVAQGGEEAPDRMEGFPGNVKVCMYWKLPDGVTEDQLSTKGMKGALLYVEITTEAANQSYTVTNVYEIQDTDYSNTAEDKANKAYLDAIISAGNSNSLYQSVNPMGNNIDTNKNWKLVRVYDKNE